MNPLGWFAAGYIFKDIVGGSSEKESKTSENYIEACERRDLCEEIMNEHREKRKSKNKRKKYEEERDED